jgi:hypothetical protein
MASETPTSGSEYEFSDDQNRLFGNLASKMALVGFAAMLFGGLQMINGIFSFFTPHHPEKVLAAAKEAGLPEAKIQQLEKTLSSDRWLSPITIAALVYALTGLFLVLVGVWTQQSAAGFAGIVVTKGQDIRRLMEALGALYKKYSLIYTILLVAAIASLISFGFALYRLWSAKGS